MGLILLSLTFFSFLSVVALYVTRDRWTPHVPALPSVRLPGTEYLYSRLPTSFAGDAAAGLHSDTFSLAGNLEDGDSRAGLDDAAKREILRIMKTRRMKFDQARKVYTEQRFRDNGIGPDGRPRDPKFVSFS